MQQRFLVKSFPEYPLAHDARINLLIDNPDKQYQIRKNKFGFGVYHRFKINEILAQEIPNAKKQHKRSKRR